MDRRHIQNISREVRGKTRNGELKCRVMLMAKSTGPSWKGSSIYISFNKNPDLGRDDNSQKWSEPVLLLEQHGNTLWYPSLQPVNSEDNIKKRYSCLRLGKKARLFVKVNAPSRSL
ncbi:MAG TPA: hypothetical protein VMT63_05315 [Bacteroidales bacterium]|nr:hypothetical protein [Bacteroidales bacterium]